MLRIKGMTQKEVSDNIKRLKAEGRPQEQVVANAIKKAGQASQKRMK